MLRIGIVVPVHNEAAHLRETMDSILGQMYPEFKTIWVDDGSDDASWNIINEKIQVNHSRFFAKKLKQSSHSPGSKVVQAFYQGLEKYKDYNFDIICKFDADIIFPRDYLEKMAKAYDVDYQLGMWSGLVYIPDEKGDWKFENISNRNHVRGPIKSYRKECFDTMGGIKPVLGWDNIDVELAKANGWNCETDKDTKVLHLRPTGSAYSHSQIKKLGIYFKNIGLDYPLAIFSALKFSLNKEKFSTFNFLSILISYQKAPKPFHLSNFEIKSIRKQRYKALFKNLIS